MQLFWSLCSGLTSKCVLEFVLSTCLMIVGNILSADVGSQRIQHADSFLGPIQSGLVL
jgi:hypothetical protein